MQTDNDLDKVENYEIQGFPAEAFSKKGAPEKPWCGLVDDEMKQCCCNCKYHLPTHENCTTNHKLRNEKNTCICDIQNGRACCMPEYGRIYTNWPKHSCGCECYDPKYRDLFYGAGI